MGGGINKKNELLIQKSVQQIDQMLPAEVKENAKASLLACKDIGTYLLRSTFVLLQLLFNINFFFSNFSYEIQRSL